MADEIYIPDNLIAGSEFPALTRAAILLSGQNGVRATVLGAVLIGAAVGAAVAGNTGNGTITAAPTVSGAAKVGIYRAICIEPAANLGKFAIEDPDGITVGVATVATEFIGGGLTFTIADGATDFAAGDSFTITIAAGSGKLKQCDKTATDGSQKAAYILAAAADATAADVPCSVYETGIFNRNALILADGTTYTDVESDLRSRSIFLRDMRTL